jgi:hypothetical protein
MLLRLLWKHLVKGNSIKTGSENGKKRVMILKTILMPILLNSLPRNLVVSDVKIKNMAFETFSKLQEK